MALELFSSTVSLASPPASSKVDLAKFVVPHQQQAASSVEFDLQFRQGRGLLEVLLTCCHKRT